MALLLISGPAAEPVSLEEMKMHGRIDYDDEDDLIEQYISAARQKLEQRCARVFVEQTWELRTASFEDSIEIPKPPTMGLVAVAYLDASQTEQTVDPALYDLVEGGDFEASSLIWVGDKPTDLAKRPDAARVQFKAGWTPGDVPWAIKQAILYTAGAMYELRESVVLAPTRQELVVTPDSVDALIAPYIVPRL